MDNYDLDGHARHCPHCKAFARFDVLPLENGDKVHSVNFDEADIITLYGLYKCSNCSHCIMMVYDVQEDWLDLRTPIRCNVLTNVYPEITTALDDTAPQWAQDDFGEAQHCFEHGTFKACVVMCRRVIEGVCVDKGVATGNLPARLRALKDQLGLITDDILAWAEEIKDLGNAGAHADRIANITSRDAQDALTFTRAILDMLYVLPRKLANRRHRNP